MNSLKTEMLLREFQYNGVRIPDPGPKLRWTRSATFSPPRTRKSLRRRSLVPKIPAPLCATPSAAPSGQKAKR